MRSKFIQRAQTVTLIGLMTLVLLTGFSTVFSTSSVSAAPCQPKQSILGIPTWYKYLNSETDASGRCSPILSGSDTGQRVNSALPIGIAVLEAVLRLAGLVAVVMIFWGGFKYITAQGSPDNAKAARSTVINALIGLVIVMVSTTLVTFVGRSF